MLQKIFDSIMFRPHVPLPEDPRNPKVTTGSVIFGAIIRTALIITIAFFIKERFDVEHIWILTMFAIWGIGIFPAYKQYQSFHEKVEDLQQTTLCGSCKYFETSGQLCNLLDEHVSEHYLPCEGQGWEPRHLN
ncbi:MAG TPA: hypothetical protein VEC36_02660 [Patescibacteria group bacterium]|nr:hypothetical protein [Patescibacteria group bacterium]